MDVENVSRESDSAPQPQPLSAYLAHPAIVILGDPGSGKTTTFRQLSASEENAVFATARDFLTFDVQRWNGKTIYIDGLDEQRATSPNGHHVLDQIRAKLDYLKNPMFRLSCRTADWYGATDAVALKEVSVDKELLVLKIEPLSEEDIITIAGEVLPSPEKFLEEAKQRDLYELLINPQTLKMVVKVVESGSWPETRTDLYQRACEILFSETNPAHLSHSISSVSKTKGLECAGLLCAVHLCAGTSGFSLTDAGATEGFPFFGEASGDLPAMTVTMRRRIFTSVGSESVTPIHRTIAEYLAARFLAKRIREDLPMGRVLSITTGHDGGTLSDLRGLFGWLATLCEEYGPVLFPRDPLGIIIYGDSGTLSPSSRRLLLNQLADLAARDPWFRTQTRSDRAFGGLAAPDMEDIFEEILNDPKKPFILTSCVIDAVANGHRLPRLTASLIAITRDRSRPDFLRVAAIRAVMHIVKADLPGIMLQLLSELNGGAIVDTQGHRLRGVILEELYPRFISSSEIVQHLVADDEHYVSVYTRFISQNLAHKTKADQLPVLLVALSGSSIVQRRHNRLTWQSLISGIILRILNENTDVGVDKIYEWLGFALDKHGHLIAHREELAEIKRWMEGHPLVINDLYRHWLSVTPFEKPFAELHYFYQRIGSPGMPIGFPQWLMALAVDLEDRRRADFAFIEAVRFSTVHQREDGPTVEELYFFTEKHPAFRDSLMPEMAWDIPDWRIEQANRRREEERRRTSDQQQRIHNLTARLDPLRAGKINSDSVHLAQLYFGLFDDVERGLDPKSRLITYTNEEIASVGVNNFIACLRTTLPSPYDIGLAQNESKHYQIGYVVLAGMDALYKDDLATIFRLPSATIQSALAFRYTRMASDNAEWVEEVIANRINDAADGLKQFWRALLSGGSKDIPGLLELNSNKSMRPIALRVAIPLLNEFPSCDSDCLQVLMECALLYNCHEELLEMARATLTDEEKRLAVEARTVWQTTAFILSPKEEESNLVQWVRVNGDQDIVMLRFVLPERFGGQDAIQHHLPPTALACLIRLSGPKFDSDAVGFSTIARGAAIIRYLIDRLKNVLSHEATELLVDLRSDPGLVGWAEYLSHAHVENCRLRREQTFTYPTFDQVIQTLSDGPPANAADLQALAVNCLNILGEEFRHGPTDGYKQFWNVDSYGHAIDPVPENDCRDRLLGHIRHRIMPLGASPEPEGHYIEDKRADIKVITNLLNVPIEIKRHYHPELWRAPIAQLKKLYVRDPGTQGRGIYLVMWFGIDYAPLPTPPLALDPPETASELRERLVSTLSQEDRVLIEVVVMDCSRPPKWRAGKK